MSYRYAATVAKVHDGDTCSLDVSLGFYLTYRVTCRLTGINARELADPGGKEARDHLAALLPLGSAVTFQSLELDKYGRALAVITLPDGRDVSTTMIRDGYAAPWDGRGSPRPVPPWPLQVV